MCIIVIKIFAFVKEKLPCPEIPHEKFCVINIKSVSKMQTQRLDKPYGF